MKKTLLSLSLITIALVGKAQNCSELFISEYVEGAGSNKAIEVYNPTPNTINLDNYRIVRYSNGSLTGVDSADLVGTIASYSTFVLCNGLTAVSGVNPPCSPVLQAKAQQLDVDYPAPMFFNGDDAMGLIKKVPYTKIDIFAKIGEDPGVSWSDVAPYTDVAGKWWTKDHSLQRKSSVQQGVSINPVLFNVTLEWDSLPKDDFSNVGIHSCSCNNPTGIKQNTKSNFLKISPNPANGSEIAIISNSLILDLNIINAIGQIVYTHNSAKQENTVLLRNLFLAKGIYYVVIKNDTGTKSEKLIIQ